MCNLSLLVRFVGKLRELPQKQRRYNQKDRQTQINRQRQTDRGKETESNWRKRFLHFGREDMIERGKVEMLRGGKKDQIWKFMTSFEEQKDVIDDGLTAMSNQKCSKRCKRALGRAFLWLQTCISDIAHRCQKKKTCACEHTAPHWP